MSMQRALRRGMRARSGDKPNARVDAMVRVHPEIDRKLTDRELFTARVNVPHDVARSQAKAREWQDRITRRLAVPEHVRIEFGRAGNA